MKMMEMKPVLFADCSISGNRYKAMWRGYSVEVIKLDSHPGYVWIDGAAFFVEESSLNKEEEFFPIEDRLSLEDQEILKEKMKYCRFVLS